MSNNDYNMTDNGHRQFRLQNISWEQSSYVLKNNNIKEYRQFLREWLAESKKLSNKGTQVQGGNIWQ